MNYGGLLGALFPMRGHLLRSPGARGVPRRAGLRRSAAASRAYKGDMGPQFRARMGLNKFLEMLPVAFGHGYHKLGPIRARQVGPFGLNTGSEPRRSRTSRWFPPWATVTLCG